MSIITKKQVKRVVKRVLGMPEKRWVQSTDTRRELYPDWARILGDSGGRWEAAREAARNGPQVLVATGLGGHTAMNIVESTLAVALTLRGARVHSLLCDQFLPACQMANADLYPDNAEFAKYGPTNSLCLSCYQPGRDLWQSTGLPFHRYSEFVTRRERQEAEKLAAAIPAEEIGAYRLDDLAVGEHALAGALRFYARGNLVGEPEGEAILRRYFNAALLTTHMTRRLLKTYDFASACFHHGIYVPQGIIGEVARQQNVPVVNWNPAYRKHSFVFSHHTTYHHTMLTEPVANWENLPWTPAMESDIMEYLKSRWQGTNDWIWFHEKPEENVAQIARELGIDFSKPCVGMLTNVMWDAQLHYRTNAFPSMREWVLETIRYFGEKRPDLQLIIRVHPAEIRGTLPSRQPLMDEIRREFPQLPANVVVIPPESQVSTYAAMAQCNAVIIYGTKTGVELTSMGIPVIVGGEAWIRNKGMTMDASSVPEYFGLLDRLPLAERLSPEMTQRARKYAYHFFFRRMIPLPFMVAPPGQPFHLEIDGLDDLLPGRHRGLDVICDGILGGSPFIYPAEEEREPREAAAPAAVAAA